MTVLVPLDAGSSSSSSSSPSFVTASAAPDTHLAKTMAAIMKAKRIVVICGAGISVQAGIPDFRSSEGLFQSIKRDNPKEQLSSGKELFDASVFNSEHKTSLFCQMIAQLSDLSQAAQPTPFHNLLRALDDRGRLLRVYTQNIDAIEQKSGLSFGVPEFDDRRYKSRSKGKQKEVDDQPLVVDPTTVASCDHAVGPRLPSPPVETPRCIPLHGTLQAMHCQICTRSFPLSDYIPALNAGQPPPCPECTSLERTRQLVGKRPRGIGRLRPSVVLYNEDHKDGEGVGEVVRRDLVGGSKGKGRSGADLVLVVGTSLRVPGTKRMVREFSKAVKARAGVGVKDEVEKTVSKDKATTTSSGGLSTPAPSPRRTPSTDDDVLSSPPRALYLNLDFPVPTREWENVFDVWIQGDAQQFAELLKAEIEKENKVKQESSEKKKRKEE
ncbi:DHS-like NAD/FAD-binding domain-containing protein, partial [Panaeolus papilionaceus]